MKKIFGSRIFLVILTVIITTSIIGVSASILYQANEIGFTPRNSNWKVNNLESALNDLYENKGGSYTDLANKIYYDFSYTGAKQELEIPISGTYKLEVWGAQGGNANSAEGGYGAYSVGSMNLSVGTKLYIYVGGKGENSTSVSSDYIGGYNGGGNSYHWKSNNCYSGAGGGATHIALVDGELKNLSSYKGEYIEANKTYNSSMILIVAGAGGGAGFGTAGASIAVPGASAGGQTGSSGTYNSRWKDGWHGLGGSQNSGGVSESDPSSAGYLSGESGSFGAGGNSSNSANGSGGGAGGGAGFFGGGGATTSDAGGSGSGFIGNPNLINKHMTCYDCETSNDEHIKTQQVADSTKKSETPIADYAKIGNGFAKITYIGN